MWLHKAGTCSSELSHTYSFPMLSAEHVYLYCESMHPTIKYPITNKTQRSYKMHFFFISVFDCFPEIIKKSLWKMKKNLKAN